MLTETYKDNTHTHTHTHIHTTQHTIVVKKILNVDMNINIGEVVEVGSMHHMQHSEH